MKETDGSEFYCWFKMFLLLYVFFVYLYTRCVPVDINSATSDDFKDVEGRSDGFVVGNDDGSATEDVWILSTFSWALFVLHHVEVKEASRNGWRNWHLQKEFMNFVHPQRIQKYSYIFADHPVYKWNLKFELF